jgi:hypothetical protein
MNHGVSLFVVLVACGGPQSSAAAPAAQAAPAEVARSPDPSPSAPCQVDVVHLQYAVDGEPERAPRIEHRATEFRSDWETAWWEEGPATECPDMPSDLVCRTAPTPLSRADAVAVGEAAGEGVLVPAGDEGEVLQYFFDAQDRTERVIWDPSASGSDDYHYHYRYDCDGPAPH